MINLIQSKINDTKDVHILYDMPSSFWEWWRPRKVELKQSGVYAGKDGNGRWCFYVDTALFARVFGLFAPEESETIESRADSDASLALDPAIERLLLPFQVPHTKNLIEAVSEHKAVLDASDTGTGKTYCACAVAAYMNRRAIVICPKSVRNVWERVLLLFGITEYYINNIEQYKLGNMPSCTETIQETPYKKRRKSWHWDLDYEKDMLIIDEAHCIKNYASQNAKMVDQAIGKAPMLFLSATMAENPVDLQVVGKALLLYVPQYNAFRRWLRQMGVYPGGYGGWEYRGDYNKELHAAIFEKRKGFAMKKYQSAAFAECTIITDPITIDEVARKEIEEKYEELFALANKKQNEAVSSAMILVEQLRLRQAIELKKVPVFVELTDNLIAEGNSVVLFVNYIETVKEIEKQLVAKKISYGTITGDSKETERETTMQEFQKGELRLVLATIQTGGLGISLHDTIGKHPRYTLISPTWNARDLKQTLGRVDRAGAKTPSTQRILFVSGTIEVQVAKRVYAKIKNIDEINDGTLSVETREAMNNIEGLPYSSYEEKEYE